MTICGFVKKRTRASPGIVAHLTSASQRWFRAVRHEPIRLQTYDQILSTGKAFVGLSSGPPHGGQTRLSPHRQPVLSRQRQNRWSRISDRKDAPNRSSPMYTYTDLMCMNYICIVCRCIRHHCCFLSRHSAPNLMEMNRVTNSGSRLRMPMWESLDNSARSPRPS
jgi:hypothetical protein